MLSARWRCRNNEAFVCTILVMASNLALLSGHNTGVGHYCLARTLRKSRSRPDIQETCRFLAKTRSAI